MPIAFKMYNKLPLNRLVPAVDPLGSRTLSMRRVIEEMKRLNLLRIDFRKAFHSITKEAMFTILPLYGIPQPIVGAVKVLYTQTPRPQSATDGIAALILLYQNRSHPR